MKTLTIDSPLKLVITIIYLFCTLCSLAQPNLPQRTNTVRATQSIHFGTFCLTGTAGGTVTVNANGTRTASGDILLLNIPPFAQPAIFEIKLNQSPNVCFNFDPAYILLYGSSGSVIFNPGPTDKGVDGACFALNPNPAVVTLMRVGGTLTVPGSTMPGLYSGNLSIRYMLQ